MKYNKDNITVTDSVYQDVIHMSPYIRKDDIAEIEATGMTPFDCLTQSYDDSIYRYTVKIHDCPVCMFGLNADSLMGERAKIWLIATDGLSRIQRRFARHSKDFLKEALESYPVLYNYIDVRNVESIKWLKWLGANIVSTGAYGVNGEEFHYFEFSSKKEIKNIFTDLSIPPRKKIMLFERMLKQHPDAIFAGDKNEPPCKHEFTEGIYTRTITIPKGMVLTGAIHKHDHPNFLMKGKVQVYTEFGGLEMLEAPQVIMSRSKTKRVVFTLEETVWSTVHLNPTEERDPDKLKKMLTAESYEQLEYKEENIPCLCG